MEHTMIEVKQLEPSPDNARRTDTKAAIEELKASLVAHGLMQNLVVTDAGGGRFRVIAGGRRLEALCQLQAEGKLPADHAVPCQIAADEQAFELSLAENTVRRAMHPADEYEAFAKLAAGGHSRDQIATRFGVTTKHVEQRLKLGNIAPELLAAYRAEELTLEALMAFTVSDDRQKQLEVFESLQPWQRDDASEIRGLLTEQMLEADSKLVKFVGLDAYHEAGGISRADLFGEEVYLESPELLHQLVADKLGKARQQLEAEGWKWVEVSPDRDWSFLNACGRIHPQPVAAPLPLLTAREHAEAEIDGLQQSLEECESDTVADALSEALDAAEARLGEIEDQLAEFVAYEPAEVKLAGCYVSIGHDGELSVEKGLVARVDRKALATGEGSVHRKPKGMPESLKRDLEAYRLEAAQVEIARHRLVALDLLAFQLARQALSHRPLDGGPDIRLASHFPTAAVREEHTAASAVFEEIADLLPTGWLDEDTEAGQFRAFIGLPDKVKLDFLAYGVALSLKPQLSGGAEDTAYELALSLTDGDLAGYWRPTRANYLGRITRDQLLALGRSLLGNQWADARARDKKGELAEALERVFADPERYAHTPEQLALIAGWLPEGMSFRPADTQPETTSQRKAA